MGWSAVCILLCEDTAELLVQDIGLHIGFTVCNSFFLQWRHAATTTSVTLDKTCNKAEILCFVI